MSIRMLIDASHQEETRVAIVDGNQVEDFDYESSSKKQLKGSIYLAKVTRVEPSLQAAFVDYGGNRHGFLAFSEIHPDYYQIPVADREALIAQEAAANADLLEDEDAKEEEPAPKKRQRRRTRKQKPVGEEASSVESAQDANTDAEGATKSDSEENKEAKTEEKAESDDNAAAPETDANTEEVKKPRKRKPRTKAQATKTDEAIVGEVSDNDDAADDEAQSEEEVSDDADSEESDDENANGSNSNPRTDEEEEEEEERLRIRMAKRLRYKYKIQEVIKKNQIILIQVVKEERGNKGAALTTYLSLPGRYCVLMPNTLHGGGVSRKIANVKDRKKLKSILSELNMPKGHACIIRTAGSDRTKVDIKRDYDYLKRMWEAIREHTLKSIAPSLIYEEGNLIKRSIRDLYTGDVSEILVEGESGFKTARDFMQMLMPTHVKKIKHYENPVPLFQRYQVENHLDSMYSPTAQLKSGGYIVINPTEALVSIDVNSGRATKEHNIEETAVKTNLEAAEEVARQLKLRDMAGLVVIDFIDMEDNRNNRAVERKMKECLKSDRARIQVGRISSFGLMEMSRQRLRVGVLESSTTACPHCEGSGLLRSVESQSLHILRIIEEEGMRAKNSQFTVYLPSTVAVYILNNKRHNLIDLEKRYDLSVTIAIDNDLTASAHRMDKSGKPSKTSQVRKESLALGNEITKVADAEETDVSSTDGGKENPRRRRRRRRGQQNRNNNNVEQTTTPENVETPKTVEVKVEQTDDNNDRPNPRRRPRRNRRRPKDYNDGEKTEEKLNTDASETTSNEQKAEDTPQDKQTAKAQRPETKKVNSSEERNDGQEVKEVSNDKKDEKPKPARRSRATKKVTEDTRSDEKSAEKAEKPVKKRAPKKDAAPKTTAVEPAPVPEAKPEPVKPKKKGWWSR